MISVYDDWDKRVQEEKKVFDDDSIQYPITSGFLREDLSTLQIDTEEKLSNSIKELEANKILKYSDHNIIGLDRENRLYVAECCFQRRYINVKEIVFRNTQNIYITNSIIHGDIFMRAEEYKNLEVIFDNCIILNKLKIYSQGNPYKIIIDSCNIRSLIIENAQIESLTIRHSRVFDFEMSFCTCKNFDTNHNEFRYFRCFDNEIDKVDFSHHQVSINDIIRFKTLQKNAIEEIKKFDFFTVWKVFDKTAIKEVINPKREVLRTLEFLETNTHVKNDRENYAKLRKSTTILSQSNIVSKYFFKVLGGFTSLRSILLSILSIFLFFSLIYMCPILSFSVASHTVAGLDFYSSLYFSGVTFLTIGYGDITPIGFCRFIAIIEGLFGVVLVSSILVSLIRKYVD